ncbi:bifunctional diguanylate cyclase/phosphohydrolase [Streptoalloteichus hindustanus]|uniref:Diguanylate cyclase (GGDEF) domain-containing protein n=1 Tax=Streptoalloteichus hindustanus TaxID=2017 RepID=A0A1M5NAY9_STRHI|nr:diguanylate cyclase [Streptoalloteichus hindustanus]SHG86153.1 diguanylate cyclase (GGDEF) domain-containing protein [Streptoalloteichus hindustanus]
MDVRSPRVGTDRAWLVYLAVGFTLVGAYYLIPTAGLGRVVRIVVYCLVSASASVAVFVGIRRHRPRPRLPWLLLGLSQLVYSTADASFYIAHYLFRFTAFPSVADPFYLGHYPFVVGGLVLFIRRRSPGRDLPGVLDAAVLAVVAGMLSWLYLIGPQARQDAPLLIKVTSMGYPMLDLALLAVSLRLILGPGRRPASFFLLSGNLVAFLAADTNYVMQQLGGTYHAGNVLDAIWLSGNLALGAAALHPTMAGLGERGQVRDKSGGPVRILALCAAALVAPATLFLQDASGTLRDISVIAAACALLFVLTIARLAVLVSDQRRLAITDGLTGLHTRRFFEAQLPLEVARARRGDTSLAVFIIDVDHFKSINDRYGHPAGDQVLIEVAARLRAAARAGDVLARYGGEEFALLVPGAHYEELARIAERLRHQVASSPITVEGDTWISVTVSVGTASYPQHGDGPQALVATADRALYAAKAAGRDRVVVGEPPQPPAELVDAVTDTADLALIDYLHRLADEVDAMLSTVEHSRAISRWAGTLAVELGLDPATVRRVELAGRLHDIGKIVVPKSVLTKTTPLTEDEWRLLRQHSEHGFRLTRVVPGLAGVAHVIRQHHERYDGAGYPDGLSGSEISVEARVLAVCDAWASMRSDRPGQPALSEEEACARLRLRRGTYFDPDAVDAFLDLKRRGLVGDLRRIRPEEPATLP